MKIEKIKEEFNTRLSIRDSLKVCEQEIANLEENEVVQRYLRLKAYYEQNRYLKNRSDDLILDGVIREDNEKKSDDIYFCYGKDFIGHCRLIGDYVIDYKTRPFRLNAIQLAKYQNIADPNDEVILPTVETEEFEKTHSIMFPETENPAQEYIDIRRQLYLRAIEEYDNAHKLKKEL